MQHCPKDLEVELCNHTKWDTTELTQDAIALLRIIRDVTLNLKESSQGTMNFVKCGVELNTKAQSSSETTEEYYKVFGARKDTVNTLEREAGHHRQIFEDRLAAMLAEKEVVRADFDRDCYNEANKKRIETLAQDKSQEEYLACLFLLMSDDGRFKPLKTQLENDLLLGQGSYPRTIIEAKRMMMEFIAPGGNSNGNENKQQLQLDGEQGLAFVQANTNW